MVSPSCPFECPTPPTPRVQIIQARPGLCMSLAYFSSVDRSLVVIVTAITVLGELSFGVSQIVRERTSVLSIWDLDQRRLYEVGVQILLQLPLHAMSDSV